MWNDLRFRGEIYLRRRIVILYSLSGEIFLFKIVKMNFTNSQQKKLPKLLDQSKNKYISIFVLSANRLIKQILPATAFFCWKLPLCKKDHIH